MSREMKNTVMREVKRLGYKETVNTMDGNNSINRWEIMKEKLSTLSDRKGVSIAWLITRLLLFFGFLYIFMCALSLMSDAFRLIAGVSLGRVFRDNKLLTNPIVDLMIGVLVTMTIHSSSTTDAIMVSMAASNVIPVDNAIYVVFGAEIGTSITSTLVSIFHIADRADFRRAFAGATIQSVYNWLSVLIVFPLEIGTHFLRRTSEATIQGLRPQRNHTKGAEPELLQALIKPLTSKIIQLDKSVISRIAEGKMNESNSITLIASNTTSHGHFLFSGTSLSDGAVGGILLACALLCVFCSLAGISKTMNSILENQLSKVIKRYINSDLPGHFKPLTGYIFILVGAVLTGVIQSSTIFTSTLTPMVGCGLISVERVLPLILGANIGTCVDTVLGALAQDPDAVTTALTVALVQVYFNVLGVIIFYPIPFMRRIVIDTGKWLGKQTCHYRWFAVVYILFLFAVLPITCIGLSVAGMDVLLGVVIPFAMVSLFIGVINALQTQAPSCLPAMFKTWDWLPEPLHSLEPYDKYMTRLGKCLRCDKCLSIRKKKIADKVVESTSANVVAVSPAQVTDV